MNRRTSTGLLTNADRDLRMSPEDRMVAGMEDFNDGLVEEAERKANLGRLARAHKPSILSRRSGSLEVTLEDGTKRSVDEATPTWIMQMDREDVLELRAAGMPLPVTAWVDDPTWPFKMRPVMNNEHFWGAIFEGYYCIRCAHPHAQAHPAECSNCFLTKQGRDAMMNFLEEKRMVSEGAGDPAARMRKQVAAAPVAAGGGMVRRPGSGIVIPAAARVPSAPVGG